MAGKIKWSLAASVTSGPSTSASGSLDVEAYDLINVDLATGDDTTPKTATVEVQPGDEGQVQFLAIRSSLHHEKLTYKVDGGDAIKLDAPQLFVGAGAVGLLGAVKEIAFTNKAGAAASIEILVGRKATS